MLPETGERSQKFVQLERDFIKDKLLPDFEYTCFDDPARHSRLKKELNDSKVALVSTCGVHLKNQEPFIVNSPTGDDSFREIPADTEELNLQLTHPGYNTKRASEDVNTVFPLTRLKELVSDGTIGSIAETAYSFMGYIPRPKRLLEEIAPGIAKKLLAAGVDVVLLVPA